jgi:hypothetical protein
MNDITPARLALTALLLTLPALTLSAPARAEIDDTKAAVIRDEGQKAQAAFVAGDYATAARLYESIEPLLATLPARERELAIVRFNLGRSYDELGRRIDAIRAYRASVAGPLDEAMRGPIRARLALIEAEALGALEVRCAVAGARVELVGHPGGGGCGHRFEALTPGPYVVAVQTRGGKRVTVPAEVVAGRSESVAAFGAVEAAGVEADRTFAWVLSGAAVASLGAGVVFNVLARGDREDADAAFAAWQADRTPANRRRTLDADEATQRNATLSYTLLGVGAAIGLAAAWVWIDGSDDAVALTPLVTPGAVGVGGWF